jgi:CrcB protein
MTTVVWVALGAAFGAPLRYLVARVIQARLDTLFPWGTLIVNVTGCLIFGILVAAAPRLPSAVEATLGIGFCGAFTTYSAFSYETLRLLEDGARFYAVVYVGASLLAGFGAVGLGWTLESWLTG